MSGDLLANAGLWWLIAALVLGALELAAPGVFLIFLAIAAAMTGLAVFALPSLPLFAQVLSFALWSGATVAIGRRWYRDFPVNSTDPLLNDRGARLIGQTVVAVEPVDELQGRVKVGDGVWPARGAAAAFGDRLRVVACEDNVLIVEQV